MTRIFRLAALALALTATSVHAQTVVGTAMVEGQPVELLSDRTWRLVDADGDGPCSPVSRGVSFCGDPVTFLATPPPAPNVQAQYRVTDALYTQFVVEGLGSANGMTPEAMRRAILFNAATPMGVTPEDIPILETSTVEIDGRPGETIVYLVDFDGLDIVFANSFVITENRAVQAMSYAVSGTYSDEHRAIHAEFLSFTEFDF